MLSIAGFRMLQLTQDTRGIDGVHGTRRGKGRRGIEETGGAYVCLWMDNEYFSGFDSVPHGMSTQDPT